VEQVEQVEQVEKWKKWKSRGIDRRDLPAAVTVELRSGNLACDGSARYRYDLNTERMQLVGVHVNSPDPPEAADKSPQACFDRLVVVRQEGPWTALPPIR
jgi:hypothetical protein